MQKEHLTGDDTGLFRTTGALTSPCLDTSSPGNARPSVLLFRALHCLSANGLDSRTGLRPRLAPPAPDLLPPKNAPTLGVAVVGRSMSAFSCGNSAIVGNSPAPPTSWRASCLSPRSLPGSLLPLSRRGEAALPVGERQSVSGCLNLECQAAAVRVVSLTLQDRPVLAGVSTLHQLPTLPHRVGVTAWSLAAWHIQQRINSLFMQPLAYCRVFVFCLLWGLLCRACGALFEAHTHMLKRSHHTRTHAHTHTHTRKALKINTCSASLRRVRVTNPSFDTLISPACEYTHSADAFQGSLAPVPDSPVYTDIHIHIYICTIYMNTRIHIYISARMYITPRAL